MFSDYAHHVDQKGDAFDIEDAAGVQDAEELLQLGEVVLEGAFKDFLAVEVGELVDLSGAFLAVAFHYVLDEVCEVESITLF